MMQIRISLLSLLFAAGGAWAQYRPEAGSLRVKHGIEKLERLPCFQNPRVDHAKNLVHGEAAGRKLERRDHPSESSAPRREPLAGAL